MEPDDMDADFPGLRAFLSQENGKLRLQVANDTGRPVEALRVAWRMPVGFAGGVTQERVERIAPGSAWEGWRELVKRDGDPKDVVGDAYFVAQLDFGLDGQAGRLYATCTVPGEDDPSLPGDRFRVLGPIPRDLFDESAFREACRTGIPGNWTLPDGTSLSWRPRAQDGPIPPGILDPEVVRTAGDWFLMQPPVYVLRTVVIVSEATPFELLCFRDDIPLVMLNGQFLTDFQGTLQPGKNTLMLVHRCPVWGQNGRHAVCFLRLCVPGTTDRIRNIRFDHME